MSKEAITIVVASLVLAFVFGFDDKQPTFNLQHWLVNYATLVVAAAVIVMVFAVAQKWTARKTDHRATLRLWSLERYGVRRAAEFKRGIPIGAIVSLLLILMSNGVIRIAAILETKTQTSETARAGRKYARGTEYEVALINAAGPLMTTFFVLAVKAFAGGTALGEAVIMMGRHLALYSLIPLPRLNGLQIYFGSPLLFSSTLLFVVVSFILAPLISPLLALTGAIILAVIMLFLHHYYGFVKSK